MLDRPHREKVRWWRSPDDSRLVFPVLMPPQLPNPPPPSANRAEVAQTGACLQSERPRFEPRVGKIPWRRKCQPTPVFLPGESHGGGCFGEWRLHGESHGDGGTLAGCSPWGHKESDMIEQLHFPSPYATATKPCAEGRFTHRLNVALV